MGYYMDTTKEQGKMILFEILGGKYYVLQTLW